MSEYTIRAIHKDGRKFESKQGATCQVAALISALEDIYSEYDVWKDDLTNIDIDLIEPAE